MTPAVILQLLLQYGPTILPLIQKAATWIRDGKTEVTPEDIAELISYGKKTSADYLADIGYVLPPSAAPVTPVPAEP